MPLTPWPWFTPAPSTSVFTCTFMWGGDQTPLASPQLTASTQPQGYPVFYCPDPWQGHRAGQGNRGENNGYSVFVFCFLKKIQFISGLQKLLEHCCAPFVHLFICSKYQAASMGPETVPLLSSEAQLPEGCCQCYLQSKQ